MTMTSDTASGLREELGQDTVHVAETLKGRATQEAETRKVAAVGIAGSASGALGKAVEDLQGNPNAPEWMAKGLQQVAQQIDRLAGEMRGRSVEDMTRDTARLARENPGTVLAVAAAAGFAAARLLRAGADHKRHAQGADMSSVSDAYGGDRAFGSDDAGMWPADENVMPTDTGTGFAPSYGAEGGTIR